LGLVSYKPQFFILIPLALIAGKRWRALLGAASSAIALALVSLLAFGLSSWIEFYRIIPSSFEILKNSRKVWPKMISGFSATLLTGGNPTIGWILQGLIMVAVVAAVIWVWRAGLPYYLRNSILVVGILLFTPYGYYYDLTLLALPLAWIGWEGCTRRWLPGEQMALGLAWLLPSLMVFYELGGIILPLAPLILITLFCLILRRGWRAGHDPAAGNAPEGSLSL
jgi:arabinofuranan 3-O-arabinosyltransferase